MEENKDVVEETTQATEQPVEETAQSPVSINEDGDYKVDLSIPVENPIEDETTETTEVAEDNTDNEGVVGVDEDANAPQEQEEVQQEEQTQEEVVQELDLPDDLVKLQEFMKETGGTLEDYVKLNTDVNELDDSEILHDYYKKTKPHLNDEEINFLLEDTYSYDEDNADEREVRKKKIALKEQVAEAKAYLDGQKSKYYEEIKAGTTLSEEQKQAVDFYNSYNAEQEENTKIVRQQSDTFLNKTDKVFNNDFKGFEFKVGDKQVTYNVSNADQVKTQQKDINNFIEKFLNKDGLMENAEGYHKGLFTAMNPDAIANHFYEQGKADAVKASVANAKNINTSRASHSTTKDGITVRVLGDSSDDMKLRIKTRN